MNVKEIAVSALLGAAFTAVFGFPGTYYFARRQTLLDAQKRREQEARQEWDIARRNLQDFTRTVESMKYALDQNNVKKFRQKADEYFERENRHEFDLATRTTDFFHPNMLKGEARILDVDLGLYFDLINSKPASTREREWVSAALVGEEDLLRVTVSRLAEDSRAQVLKQANEPH